MVEIKDKLRKPNINIDDQSITYNEYAMIYINSYYST